MRTTHTGLTHFRPTSNFLGSTLWGQSLCDQDITFTHTDRGDSCEALSGEKLGQSLTREAGPSIGLIISFRRAPCPRFWNCIFKLNSTGSQ